MSEVNNPNDQPPSGGDSGGVDRSKLPFDDFVGSRKYPLNIDQTYTDWGPREAFRELVQNCFDGVIKTNNIGRNGLYSIREVQGEANGEANPPTGHTEIVYKVYHRDTPGCLAFICYEGQKGFGTVGITNFGASLDKNNLKLGDTSKRGSEHQAGIHGEGLKLAALILMRKSQNHDVFCQTSGCNLFFNFDEDGRLYVDARRIASLDTLQRPKNVTFPTPTVNAHRDVQFIIGGRCQARDTKFNMVKRSRVSQQDFKDWTKAALLLTITHPDASVISTASGDLLTSEDLRGNLYLKGLLLLESTESWPASITNRPLGFGYNFASGTTNRERQSLANAHQEATAICEILKEALLIRPDLAGRVCDLLNSDEPRYAEAECKPRFLKQPEDSNKVALMFKRYLLEGEFTSRWLYSSNEMKQNLRLFQIIKGMGRQPFKLTDTLWGILAEYGLVNTAEQEAQRWYETAPIAPSSNYSFAMSVDWLLRACVRACPQTTGMKVEFVNVDQVPLDLYISRTKPLIRIHKRWLTRSAVVTELALVRDIANAEVVAYTVKRLFADVLAYLPLEAFLQQGSSRLPDLHLRQECYRAEQRLAKYQQTQVRIVDQEDGHLNLSLEWAVNTPPHHDDFIIEIHLHRVSTCYKRWVNCLTAADSEEKKMDCIPQDQSDVAHSTPDGLLLPTCRIHKTIVSQGTHRESGLQEGEEYFVILVTPQDPSSFVVRSRVKRVVAQRSIRPNPPIIASSPSPVIAQSSVRSNVLDSVHVPPVPQHDRVQAPFRVRNGTRGPERLPGRDASVLTSGSEPPELHGGALAPGRSDDAADELGAASNAPNESGQNVADGSFPRGSRIEPAMVKFLRLPLDGYEWNLSENSNNEQAVIGFAKQGEGISEESRKRHRMD